MTPVSQAMTRGVRTISPPDSLVLVAQGCSRDDTKVFDVMSQNVQWCFEDESVEEVADRMAHVQIRRLPVLDRDKQLVGMLTLGDMATKAGEKMAARTLESISEPAEPDRSGQSKASGTAGGGSASGQARSSKTEKAKKSSRKTRSIKASSSSTYLQDEQHMPAGPESCGNHAAVGSAH